MLFIIVDDSVWQEKPPILLLSKCGSASKWSAFLIWCGSGAEVSLGWESGSDIFKTLCGIGIRILLLIKVMQIATTGIWNTSPPRLHIVPIRTSQMWASTAFHGSILSLYSFWILTFIQLRIPFCFWCAPGYGTSSFRCGCGSCFPKWCGSKRIRIRNTVECWCL